MNGKSPSIFAEVFHNKGHPQSSHSRNVTKVSTLNGKGFYEFGHPQNGPVPGLQQTGPKLFPQPGLFQETVANISTRPGPLPIQAHFPAPLVAPSFDIGGFVHGTVGNHHNNWKRRARAKHGMASNVQTKPSLLAKRTRLSAHDGAENPKHKVSKGMHQGGSLSPVLAVAGAQPRRTL